MKDHFKDPVRCGEDRPKPNWTNIGNTHYKSNGRAIEPAEFAISNDMRGPEFNIIKYTARHNKPTGEGMKDIAKIIHYAMMIAEDSYGVVIDISIPGYFETMIDQAVDKPAAGELKFPVESEEIVKNIINSGRGY